MNYHSLFHSCPYQLLTNRVVYEGRPARRAWSVWLGGPPQERVHRGLVFLQTAIRDKVEGRVRGGTYLSSSIPGEFLASALGIFLCGGL